MGISDIAAWWGAVIATVVLVWDVFKWTRSRVNIGVTAAPNMSTFNSSVGHPEDDKLIFLEVVNHSDRLTTITHVVTKHYKNIWMRILNKPSMQGIIISPIGQQPIPYELEPGKRWTGAINQLDIEEKVQKGGAFFCGIHHSASNKPSLVKVDLH